jgi:hypothetical protein
VSSSLLTFVYDVPYPYTPTSFSPASQDLYNGPISKLVDFIVASIQQNAKLSFEVFVHKSEKLQEEDKLGKVARSCRAVHSALNVTHNRKLPPDQ